MFQRRHNPATSGPPARNEAWTEQQRDTVFLDHLERRRAGLDASMWQAPTLTIAGQAFLLRVLTDKTVDRVTLMWVLIAGVAASGAAILGLWRLRSREVLYSEAIAHYCEEFRIRDPRPRALEQALRGKRLRPKWFQVLRWPDWAIQKFAGRLPITYWLWVFALALFIVADIVAYWHTT